VVNFSAAGSGLDLPGVQLTAGPQRIGPVASLGAFASVATRNFRDIATVNGDPVPQRQLNAYASLSFGRFGSDGISYTGIDRSAVLTPISFVAPASGFLAQNIVLPGGTVSTTSGAASFLPALRARIVSANYSVQIGRLSCYATAFRDFAQGGGSARYWG
jgi:outer membrane usher protein